LDAQRQACIDFNVTEQLPECEVPVHVIAFSQDMQAPPSLGKRVADLARDGHYHLLDGLGHLSLVGHRPEMVNTCIREILAGYEDDKP
jgi:pimeloyl-ACP methyl ester carboxylesterase